MGSHQQTFVIVGAGLAAAKAAETLRTEGFDGGIVLLGEEAHRPYERPPLSKEYLRGEADQRPFVHEERYYADQRIDLRTSSRVTELDLDAGEVVLADGERIGYDRLLLATGASPRRLRVPGADLDGVHYLRTLDDSSRLAETLDAGFRLAVIGAGWIGSEVAASARQRGSEVALIEIGSVPLERVLGSEVGAVYRDLHIEYGVRFHGHAEVEAIEGDGVVERVRLRGGDAIDADVVVAGIGVVPETGLAEAAGLEVDDGVVVDAGLKTSAKDVFAAGDIAAVCHPFYGRRVRVEHWANAELQGQMAARAMLDQDVRFDEIPYFFSDQYDVGMEYGGLASGSDDVVLRGDVESREFVAFWLRDGHLMAGMNVNVWDVNETIRELVRAARPVDASRLADPDVPLEALLGSGETGVTR